MLFKPNISNLERGLRICIGLCMLAMPFALPGLPQWATWLFILSGATSIGTAAVGFCPACAMVGRRGK